MNNKIQGKAKKLGYCCAYSMLTAYANKSIEDVRKITRLSERTVQYSYAKMKVGKIDCLGKEVSITCKAAQQPAGKAKKSN